MTPGDIVLIRFPQADLKIGKLRPALVVATAPGPYPDFLLAMISSRTDQAIPNFDEIISPPMMITPQQAKRFNPLYGWPE